MRKLVPFLCLLAVAAATAAPQTFRSGERRTHLLELYSSEGCSSCPPAEAWLGGLRDDPGLWRDFVPVAFHVTYWEHLGWPDRYARQAFTARQHAYASRWSSDTVYTPGFVLDGAEWRKAAGQHAPLSAVETPGVLTAELSADGVCRVQFGRAGDFDVCVALLGGGITSGVRAGENRGRVLHHDFVVLALEHAPFAGGTAAVTLPGPASAGVVRRAVAVWVTHRGEMQPVQATGGWVD